MTMRGKLHVFLALGWVSRQPKIRLLSFTCRSSTDQLALGGISADADNALVNRPIVPCNVWGFATNP